MVQTKIFITHPVTGDRMSLKDISALTGLTIGTIRDKYHRLKSKGQSFDRLFDVNQRPRDFSNQCWLIERRLAIPNPIPDTFVFRRYEFQYEAFCPNDLINPVLDGIVRGIEWGWMYNPIVFGVYETRNELVREYLRLETEAIRYDMDFESYVFSRK